MFPDLVRNEGTIRANVEPIEVEALKHQYYFSGFTAQACVTASSSSQMNMERNLVPTHNFIAKF